MIFSHKIVNVFTLTLRKTLIYNLFILQSFGWIGSFQMFLKIKKWKKNPEKNDVLKLYNTLRQFLEKETGEELMFNNSFKKNQTGNICALGHVFEFSNCRSKFGLKRIKEYSMALLFL